MRHPSLYAYLKKCRCTPCRVMWNERARLRKQERASRPLPEHVKHGTVNAYVNYVCRCDECSAAMSAYNRERRTRAR